LALYVVRALIQNNTCP